MPSVSVARLLGGFSSLIFIWPSYGLLAVTLLGTSVAGGIIDGNTPAMLSDRSQAKYGGSLDEIGSCGVQWSRRLVVGCRDCNLSWLKDVERVETTGNHLRS